MVIRKSRRALRGLRLLFFLAYFSISLTSRNLEKGVIMERYYEDYTRMMAHRNLLYHNDFVTCEQLRDILQLVKEKKWPDGTFSDHECVVYELIKEELGIKF